jgi:Flp pilus assembly protein TadD
MHRQPVLPVIAILGILLTSGCARTWFGKRAEVASDAPQAKSATAKSNDLAPHDVARVCVATAEQLAAKGHYRESILLYEKARTHDPNAANYARRLAALHDLAGNARQAEKEYAKALQVEPDDAELLTDYGYFKYARGELGDAEDTLRRAIAKSPQHDRARMNLALVLAARGDYQASFESFRDVVGEASAHSNIGVLLAKHGRDAEAERAFRAAVTLDANLSQAQQFLDYYARQRQSDPAAEIAETRTGRSMAEIELTSFDQAGEATIPKRDLERH